MSTGGVAPLLAMEAATAARPGRGSAFTLGPVDLTVSRGDRLVVVGPNGAGKSTLLAVALGLIRGSAGSVRLGGDDPLRLERAEVARRAVLLRQHQAPAFALTCLDYVLQGRWPWQGGLGFASAEDLQLARHALETLGCGHLEGRDVGQLSGGEVQRVRLAKALAQGAGLLVLDEPTAGLDLRGTRDLARLLRSPSLAGHGVVLVTHDLGLAASVGGAALLLCRGRVLAVGPADEVLQPGPLEEAFGVAFDVHLRAGASSALVPRP